MRSWVPVPQTTSGRLVEAALELFGGQGFAGVSVTAIAARAGVTTGSLYHHFGSKAALYLLVRADVEQRVVDRLEGAAAGRSTGRVPDLAPVLLVGFDYLVGSGFTRLLAETPPEAVDGVPVVDGVERLLARWVGGGEAEDAGAHPMPGLVAAAWRASLAHAGQGQDAALAARTALERLLLGR